MNVSIVREYIDVFPFNASPPALEREEALLLAQPLPSPMRRIRNHAPIEAVHFSPEFVEQPFGPPRGVYESTFIRVEWQTMTNRQPFYHRNTGADELSYQVCGERTVMTERGSDHLMPGEFILIPNGVAHDNYGRQDIHVLFYVPDALSEQLPALRTTKAMESPFAGWQPQQINELITEGLGGPGQDIVMFPSDERLLLGHARQHPARLKILRPGDAPGTTWLYKSAHFLLGRTYFASRDGREYRRHLNADEVQYQISGQRTLLTQRGMLRIEPGDFVRIPRGVAFTSIHAQASAHITLVSTHEIPQVAKSLKQAIPVDIKELEGLRVG
jgi:uncharacterized cupin superfamily protein